MRQGSLRIRVASRLPCGYLWPYHTVFNCFHRSISIQVIRWSQIHRTVPYNKVLGESNPWSYYAFSIQSEMAHLWPGSHADTALEIISASSHSLGIGHRVDGVQFVISVPNLQQCLNSDCVHFRGNLPWFSLPSGYCNILRIPFTSFHTIRSLHNVSWFANALELCHRTVWSHLFTL